MNTDRLKGRVVECGYTGEKLAKKLGINQSTYYRKINAGGQTFTIKQIGQIAQLLNLTKEECIEIFFAS